MLRPPVGIRYAVPALLILVALGQQSFARAGHISPWKAGGFGMFATTDEPDRRVLRATIQGDAPARAEGMILEEGMTRGEGDGIPLDLTSLLHDGSGPEVRPLRRALHLPTDASLRSASAYLASLSWEVEERGEGRRVLVPADGRAHLDTFGRTLTLEVFSRRMVDPRYTLQLERRARLELDL